MDALSHFSLRACLGRRGRTTLTILSIVIGVAAVVAVSNASQTTRLAYKLMFSAVSGKAALEISKSGESGFEESLVTKIEALKDDQGKPLVSTAAPMIYRQALLSVAGKRIQIYALGIDPERDRAVRDFKIAAGTHLKDTHDLLLDASFARNFAVEVGDEVKLIGGRSSLIRFTVVGLVAPGGGGDLRFSGMAFIPLATAQDVFGIEGSVDRIQIALPTTAKIDVAKQKVAAIIPPDLRIDAPQDNSAVMKETLLSSEEGIKLSRLFILLLAIFIITNTFLMNLGERRSQLAIIRAIGGTRWQLVWMMIRESMALGIIGSTLGIFLGYVGAWGLNLALEALLQMELPSLPYSIEPIVTGYLFGLLTSLVAVSIPAYLTTRVTPLEGMRNVPRSTSGVLTPLLFVIGILLNVLALALLLMAVNGKISIEWASPAGVLMIFGAVLLCPAFMSPLAHSVAALLKMFSRIEADLALRQLLRHHLRTSLTMGVLFIAGSTGVGMSSSLLDNIENVRTWRQVAIVGDFFVRAMMPNGATSLSADLPDEVGEDLLKVEGIKALETVSFLQGQINKDQTAIVIAREYKENGPPPFDLVSGNKDTLLEEMRNGDVVLGTVLAQRLKLGVNDKLPLMGQEGEAQLRIAGVANDYLAGGLSVHVQRQTAVRLLGVQGYDGFIIKAVPGSREALQEKLQAICQKHGAILQSNADIAEMIDGMIRGIDGCLWGLVVLGFVVASFGVVNTLTMNVLEQTREIGLLRITGMTRKQVRRTVLMQAIILGGIGATPGIFAGLGTAWLINLAMMPSLGHPVQFQFHPFLMIFSWVGSMIVVLLAALFPALRAARISVVNALHYE